MPAKPLRRRSSLKGSTGPVAPAAWATVLALVSVACGGGVEEPSEPSSSSSSGEATGAPGTAGGGGGSTSGSGTGTSNSTGTSSTTSAPGSSGSNPPPGHPCYQNMCGEYLELPDGSVTTVPDGGSGGMGVVKNCYCGNG